VAQDLGEPSWILWQYNALGCAIGATKDWGKASGYFQQAVEAARAAHFITWEVFSYINRAEVASTLGDDERAAQSYRAAVELGQNRPGFSLEGLIAYAAGKAARLAGDLTAAARFFRQALVDFKEVGIYNFIGPCLGSLAVCALQAGQFERAVQLHGVVDSGIWLTDLTRMPWLVTDDLAALLAPFRLTLGEEAFTRLFNAGRMMSLEQAVALALEVQDEGSQL
jgi:tetratricopeptide (TPR) repeat protein